MAINKVVLRDNELVVVLKTWGIEITQLNVFTEKEESVALTNSEVVELLDIINSKKEIQSLIEADKKIKKLEERLESLSA